MRPHHPRPVTDHQAGRGLLRNLDVEHGAGQTERAAESP
jgi:hypothetical protein